MTIIIHDEGFEPAALQMIQDAGIQPAWIYGEGPWVVSDRALTEEQIVDVLCGQEIRFQGD